MSATQFRERVAAESATLLALMTGNVMDRTIVEKRVRMWLWVGVPVLLAVLYAAASAWLPLDALRWLRSEDGPVEWGTAIFFLAAGVVGLMLAKRAGADVAKSARVFYLLFGLAGVVAAGEEISWGQHMLGFETPQVIDAANKQGEVNLHNMFDDTPSRIARRIAEFVLPVVCGIVPLVFVVLGKGYHRDHWTWYSLPRLEMVPSMVIGALGRPLEKADEWLPARWHQGAGEAAELFWSLAVLIWIVVLYQRLVAQRRERPAEE